ncbi:MAG: hypothetical protein ACYC3I_23720 [Gemmataceae bacterium]
MDKPAITENLTPNTAATPSPSSGTSSVPPSSLPTFAWWLVLGLVGLDCFSTLGYLPTMAAEGAEERAPLAAAAVGLLILLAALPVYLYVVGRSPHGRGATGLLESHVSGWKGKLFVLLLLGFVATDFVMTRTLSTADASKHLLANKHTQTVVGWILDRREVVHDALPLALQGGWTAQIFEWCDEQLIITVGLMILGFGLYFFLLRGFTRGFLYTAFAIVALFLLLNGVVLGSSLVYLARNPLYFSNWIELIGSASGDQSTLDCLLDLAGLALQSLPALALGLSGFELSMTVAPLVRGRPDDDPAHPRGRIRDMRKLLIATAVLMAVLVPASVTCVQLLVPPGTMSEDGPARYRALAYLAHGNILHPPGQQFRKDQPIPDEDEIDMIELPNKENLEQPQAKAEPTRTTAAATGADLNPLFGSAFGTLYDLSAVLILFLAGASVTISLRELLPQYLKRYGMELHWAQRIGVLLHLFNALVLLVVLVFHARVSHQQGAYATSVLVLLSASALAAFVDVSSRGRRSLPRNLTAFFLLLICAIFLVMVCCVAIDNPAGLVIALLFVAVLFLMAGLSRWIRSTELRQYDFVFADEESGIRWEQIRQLEFQVLVPHRPDDRTLAEKEAEIRQRHRLGPDVPIIFIEAEQGDPSDFQPHPLMRIVQEDGREIIRVAQCASIAHVLAAIALEFREIGRPPEMHFAWSDESPLASNLNFLLWGQGNVPWMVHALLRKAEPHPERQPRVVIG